MLQLIGAWDCGFPKHYFLHAELIVTFFVTTGNQRLKGSEVYLDIWISWKACDCVFYHSHLRQYGWSKL